MQTEATRAQALIQRSLDELRRRAERIATLERDLAALRDQRQASSEAVAIIGNSIRLPGQVRDGAAFWSLLERGGSTVSCSQASSHHGPVVEFAGRLEDVDQFDPHFFGLAPAEAESIDPQQRLLLELTCDALTEAAIAPARLAGRAVGVYTAMATGDYSALVYAPSQLEHLNAFTTLGAAPSVGAGRIAYTFDFRGPVLNIDASCASSLVAVHLAAAALRRGECELAVVAATNLLLGPASTHGLARMGALSPSGHCAAFADTADGYVRGEGGAAIVLKRLTDAQRDGDAIAAVLAGSAINHDGRSNGLSAPNPAAQSAVVRAALRDAGIDGSDLWYVEAHGTGTRLGDPIEVAALTAALDRPTSQSLHVGSVKANVGHLEAAAGLIGVVKLLLMFERRRVPPQPALGAPSMLIRWDETPLRPAWAPLEAPADGVLHAGISGFGMSGTNVHLVLRSPAPSAAVADASPLPVLPLAAHTAGSLDRLRAAYLHRLDEGVALDELVVAAQRSQGPLPFRTALVGDRPQLRSALSGPLNRAIACDQPRIAFVFQGQGSQFPGMARDWYALCPAFRGAIERFATLAAQQPWLDGDCFRRLLLEPEEGEQIHQTLYAQPCLFAFGYALASSLRHHGVRPQYLAGHSLGEWIAAAVAGMLSSDDAFALVCARASIMQSAAPGAMAALFCERTTVPALLAGTAATLAAHNGPEHCVVAGTEDEIDALLQRTQMLGISGRRLRVAHAFHSPALDPLLERLATAFATLQPRPGQVTLISALDGRLIEAADLDSHYWVRHTREAVEFEAVRRTLVAQNVSTVIDIGPGMVLGSLWNQDANILASNHRDAGAAKSLAHLLARLHDIGVNVDWTGARSPLPLRCSPPPYPYAYERMDDHYRRALAAIGDDEVVEWTLEQLTALATGVTGMALSATVLAAIAESMLQHRKPGTWRLALHDMRLSRPSWPPSTLRLRCRQDDGAIGRLKLELDIATDAPPQWTRVLHASAQRLSD